MTVTMYTLECDFQATTRGYIVKVPDFWNLKSIIFSSFRDLYKCLMQIVNIEQQEGLLDRLWLKNVPYSPEEVSEE